MSSTGSPLSSFKVGGYQETTMTPENYKHHYKHEPKMTENTNRMVHEYITVVIYGA